LQSENIFISLDSGAWWLYPTNSEFLLRRCGALTPGFQHYVAVSVSVTVSVKTVSVPAVP